MPRRVANLARPADIVRGRTWLTLFVLVNVLFAVGLFFLGNTSLRLPLRIGVYAASLGFLFLVKGRGQRHPASVLFDLIAAVLILGLLNPDRSSWTAGVAQISLYLAVLAPLVWVGRLGVDRIAFERVVLILWAFYTISAVLGALQVKYPGRFDGAVSINYDEQFIGAMLIKTADGTTLMRPKGLTDTAGGAGASGLLSIVLGFGILLTSRSPIVRGMVICTMIVSLFDIYLSHGRTNLVIVAVAAITLMFVLQRRKNHAKLMFLVTVIGGVILVGTSVAFTVGGETTIDRWYSLIEEDPTSVAYKNRGQFLEGMLTEDIYKYPLGAGTGRWGMMTGYFGDVSTALWAEMMWQALLYDGGIPAIVLYVVLLAVLLRVSLKIALRSKDNDIGIWAGVVAGFTMATVAASFVYPVYIKAAGLEMILLNGCLFSWSRLAERQRANPRDEQFGPAGAPRVPAGLA